MKKLDVSLHADEPLRAGLLRVADGLIQNELDRIRYPTSDRGEDVHFSSEISSAQTQKHAPLALVLLDWSQAGRLSARCATRSSHSVFTASPKTSHRQTS